ncbi:globin domain-containing protein [Vogesella facilis]|uniref:Globin domain-containing protein n=1 Tax=Vogesella facilis TaxID=1655232 RepID=A0ABV7RFR2_9NEIS
MPCNFHRPPPPLPIVTTASTTPRDLTAMNDIQIDLVQRAWDQLSYDRDQFTHDIYDALFRLDPSLRPMFSLPQERLVQNLGRTLNTVLTSLHDLDSIRFIIIGLGAQHYRYGVQPEHFAILKAAMTEVLQQHLGKQLTPELAEAWSQAYDLIAGLMQQGLAQAAARAQAARP